MRAVFLSDVHLRKKNEKNYSSFLHFLSRLKARLVPGYPGEAVHELYLLGDIFDFWFSRREIVYPEFLSVVDEMKELTDMGIKIFMFEGNHDFFVREYFTHNLKAVVYEDWGEVFLDGFRFLLAHGDLVDQKNRSYLLLRRILRSRSFYMLQKKLPLKIIWGLAGFSSDLGKERRQSGEEELVEVMRNHAMVRFSRGYDAVMFGHCHLPRIYTLHHGGKKRVFAILGDWLSHFTFLYYRDGALHLMDLSGQNIGSGHLG